MTVSKIAAFSSCIFLSFSLIGQNLSPSPKPMKTGASMTVKKRAPASRAVIRFDTLLIDFGTVKEDAVIEKKFTFTNIGGAPLVVIEAQGSCGCTVPTVPAEPIEAGKEGVISVKYTAKNKVGPQKPEITVYTNGVPKVVKLRLQGWVEQIPGGVKN